MMEVMDDIVWSINPVNDSMKRIFARMRQFASEALEPVGVQTEFHLDDTANEIQLDMEKRRDLFLLFKEAINNVAKHANATIVKVAITCTSGVLTLTVADNGKGFDLRGESRGNGLQDSGPTT
jgi:signal transduction histidine kinase